MAYWTAKSVVFGRTWLDTVLAAIGVRPAGALVAVGKVRLSKDPAFAPLITSALADFTPGEANYSGYTAGGIAYVPGAPLNLSPFAAGLVSPVTFVAGTATPQVDNSVYGWWLDDGTNIVCAERFPNALSFSLAVAGDFLQLDAILPLALLLNTA